MMKIGPVSPSAVTSAMGTCGSAANHNHNPTAWTNPRANLAGRTLGPARGTPAAQHQGQHDQAAEQVAQELRLERIELDRQDPQQRVEMRKDQAGGDGPQHAAQGRIEAGQGARLARPKRRAMRPDAPDVAWKVVCHGRSAF
jgi:hypothetical protein